MKSFHSTRVAMRTHVVACRVVKAVSEASKEQRDTIALVQERRWRRGRKDTEETEGSNFVTLKGLVVFTVGHGG